MLIYQRVQQMECSLCWKRSLHCLGLAMLESSIPVLNVIINLRCPNMEYPNIYQYWDLSWDYDQNQDYEIFMQCIEIYMVFCGWNLIESPKIISVPCSRMSRMTEVLGFGGGGRWDELHSFVEWSNSKQWGSVSCFSMYLMLNDSQSRYCLCRVYAIQCYIMLYIYTCCT